MYSKKIPQTKYVFKKNVRRLNMYSKFFPQIKYVFKKKSVD